MNVRILLVDHGPTPPICFGSGSVVRQETRHMIK
jgi:hypothetical protein